MLDTISRLFGRKSAQNNVQRKPISVKQQIDRTMGTIFLSAIQENPGIAIEIMSKKYGIQTKSTQDQIFERELERNPELKRQWLENELRRRGLEGASWMQQFAETKKFMEAIGEGGGQKSWVSSLLGPEVVPLALAFLGKLADREALPSPRVKTINGNSQAVQDERIVNEQLQDGVKEESIAPAHVDPITTYVDECIAIFNHPDIEPEVAARVMMNRLNDLAVTISSNEPERTAEVERIYDIMTQTPDVIVFAISAMASSSKNPTYNLALKKLDSKDGKVYLNRFCLERDKVLKEMAEKMRASSEEAS